MTSAAVRAYVPRTMRTEHRTAAAGRYRLSGTVRTVTVLARSVITSPADLRHSSLTVFAQLLNVVFDIVVAARLSAVVVAFIRVDVLVEIAVEVVVYRHARSQSFYGRG